MILRLIIDNQTLILIYHHLILISYLQILIAFISLHLILLLSLLVWFQDLQRLKQMSSNDLYLMIDQN